MSTRYHQQAPLLVLTATLGRSQWLDATVRSVAETAGLAAAHVLIAPARRVAELQGRFPDCSVLPEEPNTRGLYGALNQALAAARGWTWEWMTVIADDDLLLPGFRPLFRTAQRDTAAGAAVLWHGEVAMIDAAGRRLCRVPYARRARDIPALVAAGYSPFNQQSLLYSRAAVERTGPFADDMRVCADAAHWLHACELGATVRHLGVLAAAFRVREGQLSGDLAVHRREFAGLRAPARRLHGPGAVWPAVLRFRCANAGLYLERFGRLGFTSGYGLLKTT